MNDIKPKQYFMEHEQMDFETQILLGCCHYGAADAGEILAVVERIPSGDFEKWYQEWYAIAERMQGIAEQSALSGNLVSARKACLRAATYFSASAIFIDGTKNPSRGVSAWKRHLTCWERFCSFMNPTAEKVGIPYEGILMQGYFFRPEKAGGPMATIIFNNGSDGPTSGMWTCGVAAALERGYAALVFDGPGQNSMLWLQNIPFRHDWEKVIAPVVDFLLKRKDVDPCRIALSGISQGGYWILRALAFEHRIAAGIADPGVMDVSVSFLRELPKEMRDFLDDGKEKEFNEAMDEGLRYAGDEARQKVEWRMKPYMAKSFYQQFKMVQQYNVWEVIKQIQCPVFIADPDDEQFWPGQSKEVYEALVCPKTIVRFTGEEGANWHCEPKARSLYDQRMFDWLAMVLPK
ncbi:MAG: alpha/beta fold hydrolase [Deltaproteobacteria bacterium]|nr:alpha/beta fold hydrolase [Deltaproteobacteria bacterium]